MTDFFRFPHTPHLAWLGEGEPRQDKLLDTEEVSQLLASKVVVEEKIDGANLGFSTTREGDLRVQNRGSYLTSQPFPPQFRELWSWLPARRQALVDALWPNLMLFGEWCWAVHSVKYFELPDWFVGFDVYDRDPGVFWSSDRRDELLADIGLESVPCLASGHFSVDELETMLTTSQFGADMMEGLIVRHEVGGVTTKRAKLVRASFVQGIDEHWSRGPLRRNRLYYETSG